MGHFGGMLLGFCDSTFEVGSIDQGRYFINALVYHREAKFKLECIGVYGPADHSKSTDFLEELETKVAQANHPVVVRGDFNLEELNTRTIII
jgi:endonuclease/exonuclease/phosphatase family metal-dependent hydrolase